MNSDGIIHNFIIFNAIVAIAQAFRWPEGDYGVLSHDKCPPNWFEFDHCMMTKGHRDDIARFKLGLGSLCGRNSLAMRYCFKGKKVPSRKGGFWTKSGSTGNAYVIQNTRSRCTPFGSNGGYVYLDNNHGSRKRSFGDNKLNGHMNKRYHPFGFKHVNKTQLHFCKIGEKHSKSKNENIEVGTFNNQKFGLFVHPGKNCPSLVSPYGIIHGSPQVFSLSNEHSRTKDRVSGGAPIDVDERRSIWTICEYDPLKTKS